MRVKGHYKDSDTHKECRKCRIVKGRTEFWSGPSKDGFHSYCKTCLYQDNTSYLRAHREVANESTRRYRMANPDKIRIKNKEWRKSHPERVRELKREWAKKNRAAQSAMQKKADKKRNQKPERIAYRINALELRRAGKGETDITALWLKELKINAIICPLCGVELAKHGRYPDGKHLDHIIPVSKGGKHMMNNVRYICAQCNIKKHNH